MEHLLSSPAVQSLLVGRPLDHAIPSSRASRTGTTATLDAHSQILLALLDQTYHSAAAGELSFSSTATFAALYNTLGVVPYVPGTAWQTQFSHLYGYGATYYSYLFDQAIASRVFKKVFRADPLSRESGEKYMDEVLRWGGGRDPWEMVGRLLDDEEIEIGDQKAMERVGKWGIDAHSVSISL
jgi:intermediate peptidase